MRSIAWFRILLTSLSLSGGLYSNARIKYPVAGKEDFDTVIYGRKSNDDYFWMSRKEKEVTEFSRQQGKLEQTILDSIPGNAIIEKEWNEAIAALDDEIWNTRWQQKQKIHLNRQRTKLDQPLQFNRWLHSPFHLTWVEFHQRSAT